MVLFKHLPMIFFAGAVIAAAEPGIVRVQLEQQQILVEASFARSSEAGLLMSQPHEPEGKGKKVKLKWSWIKEVAVTRIDRHNGRRDNAFCRFQLIDVLSGKTIGQARWIDNIKSTATRKLDFPAARGIKGLQCIEDIDCLLYTSPSPRDS